MATLRQFKCMYAVNAPLAAIDLKIKAKSDIDERKKTGKMCKATKKRWKWKENDSRAVAYVYVNVFFSAAM